MVDAMNYDNLNKQLHMTLKNKIHIVIIEAKYSNKK
jgi:hypothetical protein